MSPRSCGGGTARADLPGHARRARRGGRGAGRARGGRRAARAGAHASSSRAGERLRLSGEHTVVALAGSTGSGKSSLFNVLVRRGPLAGRRPPADDVEGATPASGARRARRRWCSGSVSPRRQTSWRHAAGGCARTPSVERAARGWSCSTCPTTTRPSSSTSTRSTGWSSSSTCWCGSSTRRSTPTQVLHERLPAAAGRPRRRHRRRPQPGRHREPVRGRRVRRRPAARCSTTTGCAGRRCSRPRRAPAPGSTGCGPCWPMPCTSRRARNDRLVADVEDVVRVADARRRRPTSPPASPRRSTARARRGTGDRLPACRPSARRSRSPGSCEPAGCSAGRRPAGSRGSGRTRCAGCTSRAGQEDRARGAGALVGPRARRRCSAPQVDTALRQVCDARGRRPARRRGSGPSARAADGRASATCATAWTRRSSAPTSASTGRRCGGGRGRRCSGCSPRPRWSAPCGCSLLGVRHLPPAARPADPGRRWRRGADPAAGGRGGAGAAARPGRPAGRARRRRGARRSCAPSRGCGRRSRRSPTS